MMASINDLLHARIAELEAELLKPSPGSFLDGDADAEDVLDAKRAYQEACEREKTLEFAQMYGAGPRKIAQFVPISHEMVDSIHAFGRAMDFSMREVNAFGDALKGVTS